VTVEAGKIDVVVITAVCVAGCSVDVIGNVLVSVRAESVEVRETVSEYVETTVLAGRVISLVEV
jgi:hypothetical protein